MPVEFHPSEIKFWQGRYRRIVGNESTFHIRDDNGVWRLEINWRTDEFTATRQ